MKSGEAEARLILEKFGVLFDDDYYDDNSRSSSRNQLNAHFNARVR